MGNISFLIAMSFLIAILIGEKINYNNPKTLFNLIYVDIIMVFLIIGFKKYYPSHLNLNRDRNFLYSSFKYFMIFGIIGLCVNSFTILYSWKNFISLGISIEQYKNGGIGYDLVASSFWGFLSPLTLISSAFSYISLGYHFYFLLSEDLKKAKWALIVSCNIFLPSLVYMARGGIVVFILLYLITWLYIYKMLNSVVVKKVKSFFSKITIPVVIAFLIISFGRFNNDRLQIPQSSVIKNPVIYAFGSYFSQWIDNGITVLNRYTNGLNLHGSSFMYFINKIYETIGHKVIPIEILREYAFGNLATYFNGLPAILVYDFGYIGAIIFSLLFTFFVCKIAPKKGSVEGIDIIGFPVLITMPIMFFQGNQFVDSTYFSSFCLFIIFYYLNKIRKESFWN